MPRQDSYSLLDDRQTPRVARVNKTLALAIPGYNLR
jgi:hypothetical protein